MKKAHILSEDDRYLWGDGAIAVAGSPITAEAPMGHSCGTNGLGPNATSRAPTGGHWDWTLGADATFRNLRLNVSDADTDISGGAAACLQSSFSKHQDGSASIADGTFVVSLTAAF